MSPLLRPRKRETNGTSNPAGSGGLWAATEPDRDLHLGSGARLGHAERPHVLARHVLDVPRRVESACPGLVVALGQPQPQAPVRRATRPQPDVTPAARGAAEAAT